MPSSLTATAPAPTSSPNSASCCPFCPSETAPIGIHPRLRRALGLAHDEADRRLIVGDRDRCWASRRPRRSRRRRRPSHRSPRSRAPPGPARAGARARRSGPARRPCRSRPAPARRRDGRDRDRSACTLPSARKRSVTSSVPRDGSMTRPPRIRIGRTLLPSRRRDAPSRASRPPAGRAPPSARPRRWSPAAG